VIKQVSQHKNAGSIYNLKPPVSIDNLQDNRKIRNRLKFISLLNNCQKAMSNQHKNEERRAMNNELDPRIDQWYAHIDKGQSFYVAAIDEDQGTVEIQHFDGDIEELDMDEWRELRIELSEQPENWSGALDIAEQDDLGTGVTDTDPEDWCVAGEDFRPRIE
jgi:hypothetical protein